MAESRAERRARRAQAEAADLANGGKKNAAAKPRKKKHQADKAKGAPKSVKARKQKQGAGQGERDADVKHGAKGTEQAEKLAGKATTGRAGTGTEESRGTRTASSRAGGHPNAEKNHAAHGPNAHAAHRGQAQHRSSTRPKAVGANNGTHPKAASANSGTRPGAVRPNSKHAAPARADGPCPVMHQCGGCTALNRPYRKQLAAKQQAMEELFAELCEREGVAVDPIRGMGATLGDVGKYPAPRGFRHKAATPFAPGKNGTVRCGFFARGTHSIVAVPACPVEAPGARSVLNGIAAVAERLGIPAYNEDSGTGLLRYAVLRCGWRTEQIMVTLVTAQRDLPHAEEFFDAVAALDERIVTVAQNINGRPGNAILGDETRIVRGAPCMRDKLLTCEFDISPTAFYQTNPEQTELLYQLAIDGMELRAGDVLMDAYCGSGTIGLCAAKAMADAGRGIMLLGVERNPAGIADARRNAELNGLTRSAWFMADDATDYILDAAENNERVDVLSIDPPRAGSTPEFLEAACALKPRRIVYISCNPTTQERDLRQLLDGGYHLVRLTPVDMFPHTDHVETVAVLERRSSGAAE